MIDKLNIPLQNIQTKKIEYYLYFSDEQLDDGFWHKREYDSRGNQIYFENIQGDWNKFEYDNESNQIYFEENGGLILEYDTRGNIIYSEERDGRWYKSEYNNEGDLIYYENSRRGIIKDDRTN